MPKLAISTCEICGLPTVFNFDAFHAIGAVIAWCLTCVPEQEYSKGDGGESPHHVTGSRLDTPFEVYTAYKAGGGSIQEDDAIAVAQKVCDGPKPCLDCPYDPCPVQGYFG